MRVIIFNKVRKMAKGFLPFYLYSRPAPTTMTTTRCQR